MVVAVPAFERCRRLSFVIARLHSARAARTRRCQCPAPLGQPLRVAQKELRGPVVALASGTTAPGIVGHEPRSRGAHVFGDIAKLGGENEVRGMRHGARV